MMMMMIIIIMINMYEAMGKHEGDEKHLQNYGRKTLREETI